MVSVLTEMILIIYVIGSVTGADVLSFWGGIIGAIALATIGAVNIYSMKRWGKTGSAILASKILARTGMLGPFGSSLVTGLVFGLGFDTATQISAITLSAVASATLGVQVALILAGFFAMGMIPVDTLDSIMLRSAFSRIFDKKGFRYMSFALSGARDDRGCCFFLSNSNWVRYLARANRSHFSGGNNWFIIRVCLRNVKKKER